MIKKNNKTCIVCNAKYTFCTHCSDFDFEPRWKAIFHDENCRKIFHCLTEYNANNIDKDAAIKELEQCDLSNKNSFKETLQKEIDELLKSKEPVVVEPVELSFEKPVFENVPVKRKMRIRSAVKEEIEAAAE